MAKGREESFFSKKAGHKGNANPNHVKILSHSY
jgi:hypothetical protein